MRCFVVALTLAVLACTASAASGAAGGEHEPARRMSVPEAAAAGRALQGAGRHAEAVPYLERALRGVRRKLGDDHLKAAKLSLDLALCYRATGQLAAAGALAASALAVRERHFGAEHPALSPALLLLGQAALAGWRFEEADAHLRRALRIREAHFGLADPRLAGPLSAIGLLQLAQGRHRDADRTVARLLGIVGGAAASERPGMARRVVALAGGYLDQGRFAQAERILRQALALQEQTLGPQRVELSATLHALAKAYLPLGRLEDAERVLVRALQIREATRGESHFAAGVTAGLLAETYRRQRRYAQALPLAARAVQLVEAGLGPRDIRLSNALLTLASVHRDEGRLDEARALYARALTIAEAAAGPGHPAPARILTGRAKLELAAGEHALAKRLIERAIELDDPRSDHPRRAHRLAVLARILASGEQFDEALRAIREATAIMRRRLGNEAVAQPVVDDSGNSASEQDYRRGIFVNHVKLLKKVGHRDPRHAAEAFEIGQLAQASDAGRAISAMASRFADPGGRFAAAVREEQDSVARWRALDALLLEQSAAATARRDLERERRLRADLGTLAGRIAHLRGTLEDEFPEYAAIAHPRPITVQEVQALLRPDEALVSTVLGRDHGYQWVIRGQRLIFRTLRGLGRHAASAAVSRIRASLDPPGLATARDVPRFDAGAAHALYQQLLAPVERALDGARHLIVVTDGALSSLPLGVLVTSPPGAGRVERGTYPEVAWLARRHAVSVLPAASSLRALRVFAARTGASRPFAGFGDPLLQGPPGAVRGVTRELAGTGTANVESVRRLPPLPESAAELRGIARSLAAGAATVFLREAATETRARTMDLSSYRVVAFATHGLLGGDIAELDEPALVMTPPAVGTADDDGLLTTSEIAELNLNAEWVVLSACNTGGGFAGGQGAPGLSGLARAFFFAGSRALLVSHWPVASEAAVRLTTGAFAARAADPAIGRAEALRRSMLALLDDPARPQFEHPFFWAPFSLVGEGAAARAAPAGRPAGRRAGARE